MRQILHHYFCRDLTLSDPGTRHRADLLLRFCGVAGLVAIGFGIFYGIGFAYPLGGAAVVASGMVLLSCPVVLRWRRSAALAANLMAGVTFVTIWFIATIRDDLPIPTLMFLITLPLLTAYVAGLLSALVWTSLSILTAIYFAMRLGLGFAVRDVNPTPEQIVVADTVALVGLLLVVFVLARAIEHRRRLAAGELAAVAAKVHESQRLESIGRMAAGLAHEINNPLACIVSNLEYVSDELESLATGAGVDEAMSDAHTAALRISGTIADLRAYASDEPTEARPLSLNWIIEWTTQLLQPGIRDRTMIDTSFGELPPIFAAQSQLGHVFVVLILRFSDAMKPGDSKNKIGVQTRVRGGRVQAELRAWVSGVPYTDREEAILEDDAFRVSREILDTYNGTLTLEQSPDVGTTFVIRLPAMHDPP
jgi:signal transduction histidine kinase